jgi:hypothetical protein
MLNYQIEIKLLDNQTRTVTVPAANRAGALIKAINELEYDESQEIYDRANVISATVIHVQA